MYYFVFLCVSLSTHFSAVSPCYIFLLFTTLKEGHPKLLIGQDYWELITTRKLIAGPKKAPALSYTKLGWIIHGHSNQYKGRVDINLHTRIEENKDEEVHDLVKYFFYYRIFWHQS